MGAYWGTKYIAVLTDDLSEARVELVDLRPSCDQNGYSDKESLCLPIAHRDDLRNQPVCNSENEAKLKVRTHILTKTSDKICELLCAIEYSKHEIEYIKKIEGVNDQNHRLIDSKNESIETFTTELKVLRKLRKSKIQVR